MENEQINEILADMISAYMTPGLSRKAVLKTAQKLATSEIGDSAEINGDNAFEMVRNALAKCGEVLGSGGESMVCGVILSGAASMNPCYVTIQLNGNRAYIKAYAKEGLIKQHTAEKAVKIFKEALSD